HFIAAEHMRDALRDHLLYGIGGIECILQHYRTSASKGAKYAVKTKHAAKRQGGKKLSAIVLQPEAARHMLSMRGDTVVCGHDKIGPAGLTRRGEDNIA